MAHPFHVTQPLTDHVILRPWRLDDAPAALRTCYSPGRAHRPAWRTARAPGLTAMRTTLERWAADTTAAPAGRWALERGRDRRIVGGASLLPLPPGNHDLGIAWRLDPAVPDADHDDYVTEVVSVLAARAFGHDVDEVFTLVPPGDAGTAAGSGMRWVGETTKYFGLRRHVYRLRPADLLDR